MTCTTEEITHEAQGDEIISNPGYIAEVPGYFVKVENPEYIPAVPEHEVFIGLMKWNWTGGPIEYTPAPPGGTDDWGWHQVGITQDSKGSQPGVVHEGNGKASYFYFEPEYETVAEVPAVGEPMIDVWVEGTPAVGEELIPNPAYVPEWTEQVETCTSPVVTCPEGKFPGWLDEFGNAQGCVDDNSTPPVKPGEPVTTPVQTTVGTVQTVAPAEPPTLAVTGGAEMFSIALLGAALLIAGASIFMGRGKK